MAPRLGRMKLPRDLGAADLIRALRILAYEPVRQDGSHIRPTTPLGGTHHVTVPNHRPLKTEPCSAVS